MPKVSANTVADVHDVHEMSETEKAIRSDQLTPRLRRFWKRRYELFSKFDEGIQLDTESWYSVTPERIAKYIAKCCKCDIIVDAFCGAGGNTIHFAKQCKRVIAIDIDPKKISMARNNARIYGVENRIEFIIGDFFQIDNLAADIVFLSPPWGGEGYDNGQYDIEKDLLPKPASVLFPYAQRIAPKIVAFLPRNTNRAQLENYLIPNKEGRILLDVKTHIWSRKNRVKGITVHYGF